MEQLDLRSQILGNTLLWLVANLASLAFIFFFNPRSSVGEAFSVAVANLTVACMFGHHTEFCVKILMRFLGYKPILLEREVYKF